MFPLLALGLVGLWGALFGTFLCFKVDRFVAAVFAFNRKAKKPRD